MTRVFGVGLNGMKWACFWLEEAAIKNSQSKKHSTNQLHLPFQLSTFCSSTCIFFEFIVRLICMYLVLNVKLCCCRETIPRRVVDTLLICLSKSDYSSEQVDDIIYPGDIMESLVQELRPMISRRVMRRDTELISIPITWSAATTHFLSNFLTTITPSLLPCRGEWEKRSDNSLTPRTTTGGMIPTIVCWMCYHMDILYEGGRNTSLLTSEIYFILFSYVKLSGIEYLHA